MNEHEGWVWCSKCNREVWALMSGSGRKWYGIDCGHKYMENTIKDLGCMNGWVNEPAEFTECRKIHPHFIEVKKLGNCWYEYTCKVCGIRYTVD